MVKFHKVKRNQVKTRNGSWAKLCWTQPGGELNPLVSSGSICIKEVLPHHDFHRYNGSPVQQQMSYSWTLLFALVDFKVASSETSVWTLYYSWCAANYSRTRVGWVPSTPRPVVIFIYDGRQLCNHELIEPWLASIFTEINVLKSKPSPGIRIPCCNVSIQQTTQKQQLSSYYIFSY